MITVPLFENIHQFRVGSAVLDNVSNGVSPFQICPPYFYLATGTRLECNTYGMLTSGGGAAAMSEIRELTEAKILVPRDALELTCFVAGYSCLMDCLIGHEHAAAARCSAVICRVRFGRMIRATAGNMVRGKNSV